MKSSDLETRSEFDPEHSTSSVTLLSFRLTCWRIKKEDAVPYVW
jgi:hypothetical protein